jgi:hypothetical protein
VADTAPPTGRVRAVNGARANGEAALQKATDLFDTLNQAGSIG